MCLLVQIENLKGLDNLALDSIAAVGGVDGVFIDPADRYATMDHCGSPGHPEVQAAIGDAIVCIRRAAKSTRILSSDQALARRCVALGSLRREWIPRY